MWRKRFDRARWLLGMLLGLLLVLTPTACSASPPPMGITPPQARSEQSQSNNPPTQLKSGNPPPQLKPKPLRPESTPSATTKLQPFFDRQKQSEQLHVPAGRSVDATPPLPKLNQFDQQVLDLCGDFGAWVDPADLQRLLTQNPAIVKQIQQAVGGPILPGHTSQTAFLSDLVDLWTANHGFSHIFCGELKGDREIGGLHYVGRYAQLQQQGIAGRLADNQSQEEVEEGAVYTVGVELHVRGRVLRDCKKGYAYPLDAATTLADATAAFKQFQPDRSEGTQSCRYTVADRSVADRSAHSFEMIFVKTDRGIVTFYPDATPPLSQPRCKI